MKTLMKEQREAMGYPLLKLIGQKTMDVCFSNNHSVVKQEKSLFMAKYFQGRVGWFKTKMRRGL